MKTPEKAFGSILRKIRSDKELSQEQLALDAGIDRTFISLLERGERQPSLTTILRISKALNISAAELISIVENTLKTK